MEIVPMKVIPEKYQCEICKRKYENESEAYACEARKPIEYPIGCIYSHHDSKGYKNMVFCVAANRIERHSNMGGSWGARDNGCGDNYGEELCWSGNGLKLTQYDRVVDFKFPAFQRMVDYLKSESIDITIWDGKSAVPYDPDIHI